MNPSVQSWLSPEGVAVIILLLSTLLSGVGWLLERMGKAPLAQAVRAKEAQLTAVSGALEACVKGVESAKGARGLDPATVREVVLAIRRHGEMTGAEKALQPIVHAVTRDGASALEVARTLTAPRRVS